MTLKGTRTRSEANKARATHGYARKGAVSVVYTRWTSMIARCTNPNTIGWARYGGRGIRVCDHWLKFENFLADMGEPPTPKHTVERNDTDGNYAPWNCRWATKREQFNNRSSNIRITIDGVTMSATMWAEAVGIKPATVLKRLRDGWEPINALTIPVKDKPRHPIFKGRRSRIDA